MSADTGGGCQQDRCPLDLVRRGFAAMKQRRELCALDVAQIDPVSYVHR